MINLLASVVLLFSPITYEEGVYSNHYNFSFKYHYSDFMSTEEGNSGLYVDNDIEFNGYIYFNDASNYTIGFQNYKLHNTMYHISFDGDSNVTLLYDDYSINMLPVFTIEDLAHVEVNSYIYVGNDYLSYYNEIKYPYQNGYLTVDNRGALDDYTINGSYANTSLMHQVKFDTSQLESQLMNLVASEGYQDGYSVGYSEGYGSGASDGYAEGYQNGLNDGINTDATTLTIFNGIMSISLVPINFFLGIFNFEILGINITGFITALVSVLIVIILVRLIFGGKSSSTGS